MAEELLKDLDEEEKEKKALKNKESLTDKISKAEATALIAMTYTIGFFIIVGWLAINSLTYILAGAIATPSFPSDMFNGLLSGEFMVIGFYGFSRRNGNNH